MIRAHRFSRGVQLHVEGREPNRFVARLRRDLEEAREVDCVEASKLVLLGEVAGVPVDALEDADPKERGPVAQEGALDLNQILRREQSFAGQPGEGASRLGVGDNGVATASASATCRRTSAEPISSR